MDWTDPNAIVVSLVSLGVSYKAYLISVSADRRSHAEAKTHAYLTFRERFNQIKNDLPPLYRDPKWLPQPDTDDWRRIELYWQNAFDEWFVPMRLNREHLEDLWDIFFKSAVESALHHRPLRYVAWALYKQGEFAQYKEEFALVLEQLWGQSLMDDDFQLQKKIT